LCAAPGHAMAEVVSCSPLTTDAQVLCWASLWEFFGG